MSRPEFVYDRALAYAPVDTFARAIKARYGAPPSPYSRRRTKDAWYDRRREYIAEQWAWYGMYLESPEWQARRVEILERDGGLCQACFAVADVVHHVSYWRVFNERDEDLVSLCGLCHDIAHGRDRQPPDNVADFIQRLRT